MKRFYKTTGPLKSLKLSPYISYSGDCEEALTFYKSCFGNQATLELTHYGDQAPSEDMKEKVIHSTLKVGDQFIIMGCDTSPIIIGNNVQLSVDFSDVQEMEEIFKMMSEDGNVTMELQDTNWKARFGMFTDKYGVGWLFYCQLPQ